MNCVDLPRIGRGIVFVTVFIAGTVVPEAAFAQAACATPPDGLVSWWRAESSAYDSASKNHGTPQGGAAFATGKVGQAFALDGVDDAVDLGPWMNLQVFSIGLWVKPGPTQVQFADIMDNNHTGARSWVIQQDGSGTPNRYVWGAAGTAVTFSLVADTWQYLTITRDGSGVGRVYVNGALVGSGPTSGAIVYDGTQYLRLGRWGGGGRYWNGAVDEIDIYNRVLSDTEILVLYQADSAGKCVPPPVAPPTPPANAIYVNGFEANDTSGWSSSGISTTPSGRKFLGQFSTGNNSVSLTLSGLPAHTDLTVAYDLYIIRSWDGNHNAGSCCGPDSFEVRAAGLSNPLLQTTFSNDHPFTRAAGQAYPGPDPTYAPRTGAMEVNSLGFTFADAFVPNPIPMDSVYRVQSTFSHTPGSVTLTFSSTVAQGLEDEAWGLDNVAIAITPPPNQPPTAHAGGPYAVDEGATVNLVGSGSDPEGGALNFAWDVDGNGTFEVAGAATTFSAAGLDGPSTRSVALRVCDDRNACATASAPLSLLNRAPTAEFGAPMAVNEGTPISLALANAIDVAADLPTIEYAFDCGDGAGYGAFGPAASRACPTLDNGPRTVRGKVRDKDGGMTEYTNVVTVANVAPLVTITGPTAESIFAVNTPVTFMGTFSDSGTSDTHTAQWLLDDLAVAGQVSESSGSGSANLVYAFASPGVYKIRLRVADDDGAVGEAGSVGGVDALVVVYDPAAGYVTGHGWIESPAGAYVAAPTQTGKAHFGFESRYATGATAPGGKTEFRFNAADFVFTSEEYEWLVVAGARAQYKGSGQVNGSSGYSFMLTAIDGDAPGGGGTDRFRIKIWNASGVVYDNQIGAANDADPTTAVAGGQIMHKTK